MAYTTHYTEQDTDMLRSDMISDRRCILTVNWMYITIMQKKAEVSLHPEIEGQRERKKLLENERKGTLLAAVTDSSVQHGCILVETEHCTYRSEERKLYVMVYKAGTLYIFRDSILVA